VTIQEETARRLDGGAVAKAIQDELEPRIEAFTRAAGRRPKLGLLLAGNDPGSEIYVGSKVRDSEALGLDTDLRRLPESASVEEALAIVSAFNAADDLDGILVQSPLPAGMGGEAAQRVFDAIDPVKDVDGFHPDNVGRLVQKRPGLAPCTPSGIIELLIRSAIPIEGRHAVVIGRSDIVGKPMALLLLHRSATVTICHSRTADLPAVVASADILVAAIGRAAFVTREFVKPGATVVDVGMNRLTDRATVATIFGDGSKKMAAFDARGSVLSGDVHPEVATVAGALTPVPGGVGPLTRAMLLANTVGAAERRLENR
jgi:methylenetetrahydrofolate dehydrogenase (NADP+)/methenyltetrahydrofolate cyclohydrolase